MASGARRTWLRAGKVARVLLQTNTSAAAGEQRPPAPDAEIPRDDSARFSVLDQKLLQAAVLAQLGHERAGVAGVPCHCTQEVADVRLRGEK